MQKKQHNQLVESNFSTLNIPLPETHVNILYCSPAAAALKGYSVHVLPHIRRSSQRTASKRILSLSGHLAVIVPPCFSATAFARDSPIPVPPVCVFLELSGL